MKRKVFLPVLLALFIVAVFNLQAQTTEYSFSTSTTAYTPITGGILLGTETSDDQRFVDPATPAGGTVTTGPGFDIGFNFTFNGIVFDRLAINNNGWISLGQSALTPSVNIATSSAYLPLSTTTVITPDILTNRVSALARDIQAQTGSSLRLETIGTAPNRTCVIQWTGYKKYSTSGTGDNFSFQIQLHETTNNVLIVYGSFTCNATAGNMQVGLRGPLATDFQARQGTTGWDNTTAATANNQYIVMTDVYFPANGLTFTFGYPQANQPPNPANLSSPANGATQVSPTTTLNWMSGGGLPDGYRISLGTDNPPSNLVNNVDLGAVTTYNPNPDLQSSTTYYWKITPYNDFGDAADCPVWSFTTHGDPTITALPYTQNWDAVTAPALPFDWLSLIQGDATAVVATYATTPYSTPNSARMLNGTALTNEALLIAPPLSVSIPANTVRVKFYAKASAAAYTLNIGVMTDPADLSTFVQVGSISPTTAWLEYTVQLNSYTGAGRYIAFRHGQGGTSRSFYVDDITFELIAANDLACTAVTGNTTPSVGNATTYTASVYNWGTVAQAAYTVKLYNSTGTELATAAGVNCDPGATVTVPLIWTPTAEGAVTLFAKVVLATDQNVANDQSPNLNITVMPAGMIVVTVGEGTLAEGVPIEFYFKNSLFQCLYYPTEIGMVGNITALTFYNNFVTNLPAMPVKFWLGQTDLADLSAGWILPDGNLTLVYDGTVDFPSGINTITIPLQTPFPYTGGNLVLYANRPMDTVYYSSSDNFQAQTIGTTRARKLTSDSVVYDPLAPSAAGTLSGTFPKTTFHLTPLGTDPLFFVNPSSKNYGTVLQNATSDQTFTMLNGGGGTLTINSITINGSPFFTLQNLPTLPVSLNTGQTSTFVGRYNPTAAGAHTATITITDNRGNRMTHTVALSGTCIDPVVHTLPYAQNFDNVTPPALPVEWSSIYQATVTTGYVKTVTTSPHSTPNCVAMYNPTDLNTVAMLIAPPIDALIPMNTVRVKFWAKGATTHHILVGVMSNPQDAATFTSVQDITITASWAEYVVSLTGFAGPGNYVVFKHGSTATGQTMYIDDVSFEPIAPNDLACTMLQGNATPSVGNATTYTATIFNWGTASQSTYTVKLFSSTGTELATSAGIVCAPNTAVQVPLVWTPTAEGAQSIYGKVFLTGDVNTSNDQSPNLNIVVQAAGTLVVTIGEGNQVEGVPVDFYYKNSLFQTLYYPSEIGVYGMITSLSFYNNFVTNLPTMPVKVWLGQTNLADLSAGWILPPGNLTLVFDGTVTFPSGENTVTIPLQTPFFYTAGNLVLYANRPMDTVYYNSNDNFKTQTIGTNRARKLVSDSTTYDPLAPSAAGTLSGSFPKTTIAFQPGGLAALNGTVTSGGSPLAGVTITIGSTPPMTQTTAADGTYNFPYVLPGNYTVTATKLGYDTQTAQVALVEDQTSTQNFSMIASVTVSVSGTVYGSDAPTVGLVGAEITLDGPLDYTGTTTATGQFTIANVLSGNTYQYTISMVGYQNLTGSISVAATNYNMGSLTMLEMATPPRQVTAVVNANPVQINLTWMTPGTGGGGGGAGDFEANNGGWVPSSNWTNPLGDWEWTGDYDVADWAPTYTGTNVVPPPTAHSGTGMWGTKINTNYTNSGGFNYLTKEFNLSGITNPELRFWSWENVFGNFDYCQVAVNGTVIWGPSWQYTATAWTERVVSLAAYAGMANVQIQFQMWATTTVNYAGWYIDDVYVGAAQGRSASYAAMEMPAQFKGLSEEAAAHLAETQAIGNRSVSQRSALQQATPPQSRALLGYKVWRLTQGNETAENTWTQLTANTITDTTWVDSAWATLPDGSYKWAVKAVFTNNVFSVAAFSNMLPILRNDMAALSIAGNVTPSVGMPAVYSVEVKNMGTDTQQGTAYTVKLMSGTTELVSVPGVTLAPNATNVFPINWTPTTPGAMTILGKVVLTNDSVAANDQTATLNITVQPAGVLAWTVGDGSQTARIPIDMYYKNSVHQYIIYPAEISNTIGQITGLTYYNQFTQDLLNMPINVWLTTTTLADLSGGWVPVTGMTQVFSGTLNFPTGQNSIFIPFNQPYLYLNGENLLLTFQRPMDTQYYQSTNYFKAQTGVPATRARNIYSDSTTYDPAAMPATGGTNTGQFAQTTFHIIPGGVGHLTGTVTGAGNVPLDNVSIQFITGGYSGTTNAQGQYTIQNILPGTYSATFSVYGYVTSTQNFTILEDETTTLNVVMTPMAQVNVTGMVYASDTAAGINGATIYLEGYADYNGNTNATGAFTIPAVYANNPYSYVIMAPGYTPAIGTINVGATNHNMGTITLSEVAYAPHSVLATSNQTGSVVDLTWEAPDPNAVEITESFEAETFPPQDWTQTIINTEGPNTSGVYPTWCRFGAVTISGQPANPTDGTYQSGLWWAYTHQDEWLITPSFNCPPGGYLTFDSYVFLGSVNADHYYVKVSVDNGSTWTELWDASAQTGGWNYYASPITIDLNIYGGQQIKLAFNASDGPNDDGLWYVWFIDNIYIGNAMTALATPAQTVRFSASNLQYKSAANNSFAVPVATTNPSRSMEHGGYRSESALPLAPQYGRDREPERTLTGYKVWRLTQGQEANEAAWTLLTPNIITALTLSDPGWQIVPNGEYRWAVKAYYTNGIFSAPSFSNILIKVQQSGMIAGVVRRGNNVPIQGATVSAAGFSATTNSVGAYTLVLPVGIYEVTCTATGYQQQTIPNITVNYNQTTTLNFIMDVGNEDNIVPVTATELLGNYPNPFNPETTVSYSVKEPAPVRIDIFNAKGQKIRTLINENQISGFYHLVWNGKDDNGQPVSSGVYMYRMTAGSYTSSRKMILMQ